MAVQTGGPPFEVEGCGDETLQRQYVRELAARKISGFRRNIDENGEYLDDVYQSVRSLSGNVATDYRDRFLIELVQNAYDAHRVGTRHGRVEIVLDRREGEYGTLFVANTGRPFHRQDVKSLCDIGLSLKPIGESIGNKGLGFRSVLQITDRPRIYSQCPTAPGKDYYSGFCFRFAEDTDYSNWLDHSRHLELAKRDLPTFHLPMYLDVQSDVVRDFASAGAATVVELPLRDANAGNAVQRQIELLQDENVPILLFLDRLSMLRVLVIRHDGQVEACYEFTRSEESLKGTDVAISLVELGSAGSFMVCRQPVAEEAMQAAISAGVDRKELHEHWETWEGEGDVAVGLRLDAESAGSRLYTFLPMGEQAEAPFRGYLHGSFSTSANRKNLNARVGLNALLLTEATLLTAKAIHCLITDPVGAMERALSVDQRAAVVTDLLCWSSVSSLETDSDLSDVLATAVASRFGVTDFVDAPVLPCRLDAAGGPTVTWQPPAKARRWPTGSTVFTESVAALHADDLDLWPLWPALASRLDRLDQFLEAHADGYPGGPRAEERATLAELVASTMGTASRPAIAKWGRFFRELPDFMGSGRHDGPSLAGRAVLLGDDGQLHKAMKAMAATRTTGSSPRRGRRRVIAAIFSPPDPRRASTDDEFEVDPPRSLSNRFGFPDHGPSMARGPQ